MENAIFYHFNDGSKPADEVRNLDGIIGTHIDDAITVSDQQMKKEVLDEMKHRFTFGSHDNLPFKYGKRWRKCCDQSRPICK